MSRTLNPALLRAAVGPQNCQRCQRNYHTQFHRTVCARELAEEAQRIARIVLDLGSDQEAVYRALRRLFRKRGR